MSINLSVLTLKKSPTWGLWSLLCGPLGAVREGGASIPEGTHKQKLSAETLGLIKVPHSCWDKTTKHKAQWHRLANTIHP